MKTYSLTLSDLDINRNEIFLNLGYGSHTPDPPFIEMVDEMLQHLSTFCFPQAAYVLFQGNIRDKDHLEINHKLIKTGSVINRYFDKLTHFGVFVVTAGAPFDNYLEQLRAEDDLLSEFLAYSIGTEIAEAAVRFVSGQIKLEALQSGFSITQSYSPGHCSWNVREQQSLFSVLPDRPCGIVLNESGLMYPLKSISGIIGMGPNADSTPHGCEICGLTTCFKRKVKH